MLNRKLTREEIEKLDLPKSDKRFALMAYDSGANVVVVDETKDGYTLNYIFTPDKH